MSEDALDEAGLTAETGENHSDFSEDLQQLESQVEQQLFQPAWKELLWNPAQHLHESWWTYLKFDWLKTAFDCDPDRMRGCVNRSIIGERRFPISPLPRDEKDTRYRLLALSEKLDIILMAAGLQAIGNLDYLLSKSYRQVLLAHLPQALFPFLISKIRSGRVADRKDTHYAPEELVENARLIGVQLMHLHATQELGWKILMIRYSAPDSERLSPGLVANSQWMNWAYLLKLERLIL